MVTLEELDDGVGADVTGAAGDEDVHGAFLSCYHSALKPTELSPGCRGVAKSSSPA